MYAIKAGTKDEDWADAFHHCLDLIDDAPTLSVPADKRFQIDRFALDALHELRKTRGDDEKRIASIIEKYSGHVYYSRQRMIYEYQNLDACLAELEPITKIRDHGGYAVSATIVGGIILLLLAIVYGS